LKKKSPAETEVILPHASAEVLHPQKMELFVVADAIDPQEAEESSITIIDIAQTKKASTQVQNPFAVTL
jgi:hypothetical protein